jgi:uncharacterized protein with HEPN domain
MSEEELRGEDYLAHMIEAVNRIQKYTQEKFEEEFDSDILLQDGVLRNIAVLGEAAKELAGGGSRARDTVSVDSFAKIYGMRNQVEHGYYTIDFGIVWNVVEREIPKLRTELAALQEECARRIRDRLEIARELGGRCWFRCEAKSGEESPNSAGQCAG